MKPFYSTNPRSFPSCGSKGPLRSLVTLLLSMTVWFPAHGAGPSLFPGESITIRTTEAINTGKNHSGDHFRAVVDRDIEVKGLIAIPRGSIVNGTLKTVVSSGRLRRRAELTMELDSIEIGSNKQSIDANPETRLGKGHAGRDAKFIGGGALFGLTVGALAGGGKGAGIGTLAGGAAGATGAAISGKEEVYIPAETVLVFHLRSEFKPELPAEGRVGTKLED